MALLDRILRRDKKPQKYISLDSYGGFYPLGFVGTDNDLFHSKAGAAAAYMYVSEVGNCIQSITSGINMLDWNIKEYPKGIRRKEKGEIVANSADLMFRHPLQEAFTEFQSTNDMTFIDVITTDYLLYGEVYIERVQNIFGSNKSLEWLNPLGVQVDYHTGKIDQFRYGWNLDYVQIPPDRVAYLHNRNPTIDFTGWPTALRIMDEINIARNLDRFLRDYFRNNARPGMVITPMSEESTFSEQDYKNMLNIIREQLKGVGNQYSTLAIRFPVNATTFDQPDLAKNVTLDDSMVVKLYEAYGVPQAMRGNTKVSPYKSGDEVVHRFYMDAVIPLARTLQLYINVKIMPFFDNSGLRVFEFDTSPFDTVTEADRLEAEVLSIQISDTLIDLYTAAETQEIEADTRLKGLYMVQGIPVPIEQLGTYWEKQLLVAPSVFNAPEITGQPLPEPTDPEEIVPTEEGAEPLLETEELADIAEVTDVSLGESKAHTHDLLPHFKLYKSEDIFPTEREISRRLHKELHAWKRYEYDRFGKKARKQKTREFETKIIPPWIRFELIDRLDKCECKRHVEIAFDTVLDAPAIKSITSYQRELRDLSRGLWNDSVSIGQFQTGMERTIDREFRNAFVEGVQRGGIAVADLEEDERAELDSLIEREKQFIDQLSFYIYDKRKGVGKLNSVRRRVDRWVARYMEVREKGYLIAKGAEPLMWKVDVRKEHCRSCAALNGQIRRASYWRKSEISPQSSRLECFGVWCGCSYVDPPEGSRISRGRLPRVGWRS